MSKSHRDRRWYDEPRMKEVRKGANKFEKHRKNMYKYSSDQQIDDEEFEDDDRDDYYDTYRQN